ncbi:hypothetical protein Tco_0645730 [Tanacetum coccineum]
MILILKSSHHGPSDAKHNPSQLLRLLSKEVCFISHRDQHVSIGLFISRLQEDKVNMREAVDAGLVVTESSGTKPDKQDTSSSSGNYTTQAVDADIGPVNGTRAICEVLLNSSAGTYVNCKGKTRSLVTKKTDISYVRSSRNSNLMNMLQMMSVHISSGLVLHLDVVWTKQFKASFFILMSLNKTVQTSFLNVKWRLLASLQALFLKVKKGVRLQRKGKCLRDHSCMTTSSLTRLKALDLGSGYQQKDRKPSQNDKTEHGMEKTMQAQDASRSLKSSA